MSDVLVVVPFDGSEDMSGWLRGFGIDPPSDSGRVPEPTLLGRILQEAGWPYRTSERYGAWAADFESRDERWPPVQQLRLHDGSLAFRLWSLRGGP